jgi:hypothetical protein
MRLIISKEEGTFAFLPTVAITFDPQPKSIQFYWLCFRILIVSEVQ